jgi:hypothetical protein
MRWTAEQQIAELRLAIRIEAHNLAHRERGGDL